MRVTGLALSGFTFLFLTIVAFIAMANPTVFPTGTTIYDPERAWNGYVLFSAPTGNTHLIDMDGNEVNQWDRPGFPAEMLDPALNDGKKGHILVQIENNEGMWGGIFNNIAIGEVDWDGQKRKTIYVAGNKQALPQPFAITMSSNSLFWTDWDTNSLYSYNISTDQVERLKVRGKLSPMDIRVFEPNRQPKGSSPCNQVVTPFSTWSLMIFNTVTSQDNGGCSHLCLAAPYPPSFSCACPTGFKLLNKTTCADNNAAILLVAARESIIKVCCSGFFLNFHMENFRKVGQCSIII